jgi:hypothetical protein
MSIIGITRFIVMPYLLWRAKRRSKRDNQMTIAQLETLHTLIKSNRSKL